MKRFSLSQKTFLAVFLILLPISLSFLYVYNANKKYLKSNILDEINALAEAYEGQVYQFLEMAKRRAQDFASDGLIRAGLEKNIVGKKPAVFTLNKHLSKNKLPLDKTIRAIHVISLDSRILASTNPPDIGKDVSHEDFFIKGKETPMVTESDAKQTGVPGLIVSAPVISKDTKRTIGFIANFICLSELNKLLTGEFNKELGAISSVISKRHKTIEVYLVNKDKRMLTESRFINDAVLKQLVDTRPVQEFIKSNKEITGFYYDYRGVEVAGASMCFPSTNWVLIVEIDKDEALTPLKVIRRSAFILGIIVIGLIGVLFALFLRNVVKPLSRITSAVKNVAAGVYDIDISVQTSDEIGTLGKAFNTMAAEIKDRTLAIREREERLQAILDNSTAVIYVKDTRGRYILLNRWFNSLFNLNRDSVIGKTDYDRFPKEIADTFRANDLKVLEAKTPMEFDEVVPQKDGLHTYISSKFPLFDTTGVPYAICGISTDITERKRMEEELKRHTRELKKSNKELQHFAYIASHDLQEPLRMISSYLQLIETRYKGRLDADADEFIAYAVDGANRLQNMINGILAYSRVETHGKSFEPADCEVVLEHALANLKIAIEESNAVITHDSLPTVMADDSQLVSVFQNLIGNAIKFHGTELPRIYISAKREENEWVFSVRDNGIGINPKHTDRLFTIFRRFHGRKYPGVGIGLSVCKRIVEHHNGRIWVESETGKGSTFYFTIPVHAS